MYCKKCGKYIDYNASLCHECQDAEILFSKPQTMETPVYKGSRMDGFGPALTATILSFFGFVFSYAAFMFIEMSASGAKLIILVLLALGLGIPAIVLGAKSISLFKENSSAGMVKPIPTLILGIVGLAYGACTAIIAGCTLLLIMMV